MQKNRFVFLIILLSTYTHITPSQETQITNLTASTAGATLEIINLQDPFQTTTTGSAASHSSWITKVKYGIAHVAGQTRAGILFKMSEDGTLQADAAAKPAEALRRIIDATEERHTDRNLRSPENQDKISKTFAIITKTADETGSEIELAKALARKYNELQAQALTETLQEQATILQPQLEAKKQELIKIAHGQYNQKMSELFNFSATIAANKRYVHKQARDGSSCPMQDEKHYQNLEAFEELLASIRSAQK